MASLYKLLYRYTYRFTQSGIDSFLAESQTLYQ